MGISMSSSSSWHSSAGRHTHKKPTLDLKLLLTHLWSFSVHPTRIYQQQTAFQWHRRAARAPGRCWWRDRGSRRESASHGTCKRTPGCLAGSPDCGSGPRRPLEQRITQRGEAIADLQLFKRRVLLVFFHTMSESAIKCIFSHCCQGLMSLTPQISP